MLCVRGISKSYAAKRTRVTALDGVDLDVPSGELTAILGPSGCGKSTLLRVIAGFERPDAGTLTLDEQTLVGTGRFVRPERRGIGIVPQDGALFPHLDVAHNIGFGLRSEPRAQTAARVRELLDLVGLPDYQRRAVHELSGGEQKRIALARALAPRPHVVLLDEPFSAIDAALRGTLGTELSALLHRLGVTAVLVTHDQTEALRLADHLAVMRSGRIAQTGSPREVYEFPADAPTARFVGDAMVLTARILDDPARARCLLGVVDVRSAARAHALAPGAACEIVVRPEDLTVSPTDGPDTARVTACEYYGHDAMLTLALPGEDLPVRVRVRDVDPAALVGRSVAVEVRAPALLLG